METALCRVCDTQLKGGFTFREMMFGFRDRFNYGQCPNCQSLQILQVPANIDKYYPSYYVAFAQEIASLKRLPFLKRVFVKSRIRKKFEQGRNHELEYLKPINIMPDAHILDIGCGRGALICGLYNLGYEKVGGVDKFIPSEIDYGYGVKVQKKDLSELDSNAYDLLMMHHVLEHMDEQVKELKECYRLLKKNGVLLIRIPVIGTAWDIYQENWVQLDAPRHFVLHTLKSMNILAEKTGFVIEKTIFDSNEFQFWGSELYKKDIPLTLPDTHEWYPVNKTFSNEQIERYKQEAIKLNVEQKGDAAMFYLRKK